MNESVPVLEVRNISKRYADVQAVDGISFTVSGGEIFGLLGPNGAGKTTTIRIILDIIKAESGQINVFGGPMNEAKKARIGYLPEERGLYEDMTLWEVLLFLGQLKGLSRGEARRQAEKYLKKVKLWDVRQRKIEALSRGMTQKAQFVAATMHEPDLLIVDEPFAGLDPVNTRIIKQLIGGMVERGAAVIMSTHQMHQVEAMCQRILLMNRGQQVLYGPLQEIRRRFAANALLVQLRGEPEELPGVRHIARENGNFRFLLEESASPEEILQSLVTAPELTVERFEKVQPTLDEIFVEVVGRTAEEEARAQ